MHKQLLIGLCLLTFTGSLVAQGQPSQPYMTMSEFVEVFIPFLGLEVKLPPDLAVMPAEQAFRVETALLISNGLPYFYRVNKDQFITRGFMADVLFELVHRRLGIMAVIQEDKIRLLAEKQLLTPGNPGDILSRDEIMALLRNPILTDAVAAFYSLPPFLGTDKTNSVTDPFGTYRVKNVTEQVSSTFQPPGGPGKK